MALEPTYIDVYFKDGVDTKEDSKTGSIVGLDVLKNGVLTKVGRIDKRNGYLLKPNSVSPSSFFTVESSLSAADALGNFKNELLLFNNGLSYSFSEQAQKYIAKGHVSSCSVAVDRIVQNVQTQSNADIAQNENIQCIVYEDSSNGVRATVRDVNTGTILLYDYQIASASTDVKPKCINLGAYIYVFWMDTSGNALKYRRLSLSDLSQFESATSVPSGSLSASLPFYDIAKLNSTSCTVVLNTNGATMRFGVFNGAIGTPTLTSATVSTAQVAVNVLTIHTDIATGYSWVVYRENTANRLRYFVFDQTLTEILVPTNAFSAQWPQEFNLVGGIELDEGVSMRLTIIAQREAADRTFAPSDVTVATEQITITGHQLALGQKVQFTNSGGGLPAGLSVSTDYFVYPVDANNIKVHSSLNGAMWDDATTLINITTQGTGTHSIVLQERLPYMSKLDMTYLPIDGSPSAEATQLRGLGLASKGFLRDMTSASAGKLHFNVVHDATNAGSVKLSTYFLLNTDFQLNGGILAKVQQDRSNDLTRSGFLPRVINESDEFIWPAVVKDQLDVVETTLFTPKGISLIRYDFESDERYYNEEFSNNNIIGGGYVSMYDGGEPVELGFHYNADPIRLGKIDSSGTITAGTYGLAVVFEWRDNQGQIHQSTPAFGTITTTAATSRIRVLVPSLVLTKKINGSLRRPVNVVLYMTENGGTLYYRATSITSPVANLHGSEYLTTDLTAPVSITSQPLYTDSGELDNVAPPACKFISKNRNRVVLSGLEDENELVFSKLSFGNNAPSFSDEFVQRIDGYGPIRSVRAMDEKWVIFTKTAIHYFAGQGPLDNGEQNDFTDPQLITSDVGSDNPNSIVEMPLGLMFQSPKGIYLLNRNLQVEYIGAQVEDLNGQTITSATLVKTKNQVRFLCSGGGDAIVYDYFRNQWSTWTNHDSKDSTIYGDNLVYLRSSGGDVFQEDGSTYLDSTSAYSLKVETPWLKLADIQNFARIWKMALLGEFYSDHILQVRVAYDYQPFFADTLTWDPSAAIDTSLYGDESLYGGDDPYGGSSDVVYQVSFHMPRQLCEAIKFEITDINSTGSNRSFSLNHLQLECGLNKGLFKMKSEKTAG